MVGGLSAATSICAAMKGDCNENIAGEWHNERVAQGYSRFLLVVLSAAQQILQRESSILSDADEDSLDRAFTFILPGKLF